MPFVDTTMLHEKKRGTRMPFVDSKHSNTESQPPNALFVTSSLTNVIESDNVHACNQHVTRFGRSRDHSIHGVAGFSHTPVTFLLALGAITPTPSELGHDQMVGLSRTGACFEVQVYYY